MFLSFRFLCVIWLRYCHVLNTAFRFLACVIAFQHFERLILILFYHDIHGDKKKIRTKSWRHSKLAGDPQTCKHVSWAVIKISKVWSRVIAPRQCDWILLFCTLKDQLVQNVLHKRRSEKSTGTFDTISKGERRYLMGTKRTVPRINL